jgi:hypothetical protein
MMLFRLCLCLSVACVLTACGSGSGAVGVDGSNGGGGGGSTLQANFQSIQDNVFTPICTACHVGATAPQGLRLDEANSYALLVGVSSAEVPALQRVRPGDPDNSYLIQKLEGSATVGEQMPLGMTPLPQADIDVIRQWITDGAQPPMPATPPSEPIRVSSLSPVPDSTLSQLPGTIMAVFDRELDASSVNGTTFIVERSGGDGTFGDGNEVTVGGSVSVPAANPMTAVFDLGGAASVPDTYRVRLIGTGPAVIQDLDANALDGEFAGAFPSGDGTEGGNFEAVFDVAGIQTTLQSIQDDVFTPTCSGCHDGGSSSLPGSMDLTSAGASFTSLVGVTSVEDANFERVTPGDPDNSYLIQKLEGTASQGVQMPAFGTPLDQATIDMIRQWITDGANM